MRSLERATCFGLVALALAGSTAWAQDEESLCSMDCERVEACTPGRLNPALREALGRGTLPDLRGHGVGGAPYEAWATSMLAARGEDPTQGKDPRKLTACQQNAHATWTCMHSARAAQDQSLRTAWCEGRPDEGRGEILLAEVASSRRVEIWAGFGASEDLFRSHARPRKVRVYLLCSTETEIGQCGTTLLHPRVVTSHEIELAEMNGFQALPLPEGELPPAENPDASPAGTLIAIEVLSVYPGTENGPTCVTEIQSR